MHKEAYQIGKATEYKFAAQAKEEDLVVCFPDVVKVPYDFIVVHGAKTSKIQVKKAGNRGGKNYLQANVCSGAGNNKARYEAGVFDYFAINVNEDFYIIPQDKVTTKTWTLSGMTAHRWKKYLNNWDLLKETPRGSKTKLKAA